MSSTHYMDLLMQNSPWNLILFMAIPVVLAETIAITELLIPLLSQRAELTTKVNRACGVLAGIAFIGIILYLVPAVVLPLASNGEFRTSLLAAFLVFSHIAMIFGMVDPSIAGYQPAKQSVEMNHSHHHSHGDIQQDFLQQDHSMHDHSHHH